MTPGRPSCWTEWANAANADTRHADRWREPRVLDGDGITHNLDDGRVAVSFASNDYLGLTQHPTVIAAAHDALDRWGAGSGSARLIVGARPVHDELESALTAWKRESAALLFPTGFMANLGVLSALGGPDVLVCSDELNHASIIDGCRMSRSEVAVHPHADLDRLETHLARRGERRALVVSDTVFSMDGDAAPVDALCELCARHGALLVLDEAHAVLGPEPSPDALAACDHVRVGTLSKALGSLGGFAAGPAPLIALLVNRSRPFIFTTAPTPADTAAALAAVRIVDSPDGRDLVRRLRANTDRVRPGHPSPIVPIVCGEERRAIEAAAALLDRGLIVPAIRPPTVAPGTARLRVTLSAIHTDAQIDQLQSGLDALGLG